MIKLLKNWLSLSKETLEKQGGIFLILLFFTFHVSAQVNFVGNPSFEVFHSGCTGVNFTSKLKYWGGVDSTLTWGGGLTYNSCYSNLPYSGPGMYQAPKTGNGIIRSTFYCSTVSCSFYTSRTYAKNRMLTSLTSGKTYCVKMYVNLLNDMPYAISNLEILLADISIDTIKYSTMPLTYLTPQITNTLGVVNDTLNWIEVSGTFVANGTEKYLVIGNFKSDAVTASTASATGVGSGVGSEYNIDDVSVIDFNLSAYTGPDKNINLGDSAFIGRPPEIGLECTWTTGTTTVGSGGGIWVKPTSLGTFSYVVTQNICGNIKTDTVNVNVSPSGINENTFFANSISVYPQPAKDILNINLSNYYEPTVQIKIVDVNGREILNRELQILNFKTSLSTEQLSNGVYILQISNSKNQTTQKRLIIAK